MYGRRLVTYRVERCEQSYTCVFMLRLHDNVLVFLVTRAPQNVLLTQAVAHTHARVLGARLSGSVDIRFGYARACFYTIYRTLFQATMPFMCTSECYSQVVFPSFIALMHLCMPCLCWRVCLSKWDDNNTGFNKWRLHAACMILI